MYCRPRLGKYSYCILHKTSPGFTVRVRFMVFNATSNNISVISCMHGGQFYWWRKTRVPGENHRPLNQNIYLIKHVSAETMINEQILQSETNGQCA